MADQEFERLMRLASRGRVSRRGFLKAGSLLGQRRIPRSVQRRWRAIARGVGRGKRRAVGSGVRWRVARGGALVRDRGRVVHVQLGRVHRP